MIRESYNNTPKAKKIDITDEILAYLNRVSKENVYCIVYKYENKIINA